MSVSAVGGGSSVVGAAFRQFQVNATREAASSKGQQAVDAKGAEGDVLGPTIQALKEQLEAAQKELQRLVEGNADEEAIRQAQQKVQMCASALSYALTKQAEAEKKAQRSATGDQYI